VPREQRALLAIVRLFETGGRKNPTREDLLAAFNALRDMFGFRELMETKLRKELLPPLVEAEMLAETNGRASRKGGRPKKHYTVMDPIAVDDVFAETWPDFVLDEMRPVALRAAASRPQI
jgi:hypothetical protein